MTIAEFVEQVSTVYRQNQSLFLEGPSRVSPAKNAANELHRAAAELLQDSSEKKRQAVEGAIYLCESMAILSSKESDKLVKELYEAE